MGAGMLLGCRSTPLHPLGSLDDHAYVLEDAGIETLVFDPEFFGERAAALAERVPGLKNLLAFGPERGGRRLPRPGGRLRAPRADRARRGAPTTSPAWPTPAAPPGKPKGVMGSYRSGATMTQIQMTEWEWPHEPRFLMCTPLSHAGAAFFVPVLLLGGSLVVVPYFEPGLVLETIERERITATMLVPTMLYVLMDHPDFATRDLSSLETVYYGAAAISPTRLREAIGKLGPIFFQYYGQAEGPMTICVLRKDEHDVDDLDRLATCGRPVPWVHVKLLDDDLNEVPPGRAGRDLRAGPAGHAGLLEQARADGRGAGRRLAAHRRHRPRGRARLLHHRRPQEGHGGDRRVQRVPPRGRGRHLRPPGRGHRGGHRRARRALGRGGQGRRRPPPGRGRSRPTS